MKTTEQKIIAAGVRNLREFGYPDCDEGNIWTDRIYSRFFDSMLKDHPGNAVEVAILREKIAKAAQRKENKMTTEQKTFTPGPWSVDPKRLLRVCGLNDITVATTGCDDGQRDRWEANARLIAAAPLLLEALKGLLENLPERRDWLDPDVERFAKAAIEKATK